MITRLSISISNAVLHSIRDIKYLTKCIFVSGKFQRLMPSIDARINYKFSYSVSKCLHLVFHAVK